MCIVFGTRYLRPSLIHWCIYCVSMRQVHCVYDATNSRTTSKKAAFDACLTPTPSFIQLWQRQRSTTAFLHPPRGKTVMSANSTVRSPSRANPDSSGRPTNVSFASEDPPTVQASLRLFSRRAVVLTGTYLLSSLHAMDLVDV
jgi:hypothetical protein